ncbi:MFS transporter [Flavobacterium sp. F-65]|uniref:MFS transporter n=1 Tax=Flavobacterium pisciphilum TaxID=2893755 RepID=A0ABS8MPT2_9FLAO|nr:MFS transporter [Flavobacterium sp. F-65]MCC9070775.1 MFS transporter [Flavobacterium sp. F-65]
MLNRYLGNFKNFPKEIWILALITLVNRIGAVVVPFLSKYFKDELNLSYSQIGWIMVCFGIGSLFGTFFSGKLSDIFGSYKVMVFSLFGSGVVLLSLQFVKTFELLCLSIFFLTAIADMYRPAMMVSLNDYVSSESRVRALSLLRMATNVGLVVGPVLGGLLIINSEYNTLFIVDGLTSIISVCFFVFFVKEKKLLYKLEMNAVGQDRFAPLKDFPFVMNWIIALITGYLYFQVFSIVPIYHKEAYQLTEFDSGMFLGFSGIVFILFELAVVNFVQKNKITDMVAIMIGLILIGTSYLLLFLVHQPWIFWVFMLLMSFGNMLTFAFASGFVMNRSHKNLEGLFMSTFQMSYGFAHVFSSKTGLTIVQNYDYNTNWVFNYTLAFVTAFCTYLIFLVVKKEQKKVKEDILVSFFKK